MGEIEASIVKWIKDLVTDVFNRLLAVELHNDGFRELMNQEETCRFLGISADTFRDNYRYLDGFPKELPAKCWSKRAIKEWLKNQI